jgi:hypothetical protein
MTDQLRNEIREIIADLAKGVDSLSFTELSNLSEELLDRALLAEFLAYRANRKTAIQERLQKAVKDEQQLQAEKPSPMPKPEAIARKLMKTPSR